MIAAALLCLAVAAAAGLVAGFGRARTWRLPLAAGAWYLTAAAALVLVVAGGRAVAGHPSRLELPDLGGLGPAALQVDRLSGLFLVITMGVAVPAAIAGAVRSGPRPRLPALIAAGLAAVVLVQTADHLFVLLFGWESLTACFYLLTAHDRDRPGRTEAAVLVATFGKISGAALLLGGGLLAAAGHSYLLGEWPAATGGVRAAGYGLLILGFAVKVGLVPLQGWLPAGYAAAPGPARAVMAGAAVNVGFYGMWRTLDLLGGPPIWLIVALLVLGGLTAVLGIAHASVNVNLPRLIAWSSVENAGLIVVGFAVALTGAATATPGLTAAGLLAATAQVVAHAVAKTVLYLCADDIETSIGSIDLDRIRGLAGQRPVTGAGLAIGALTLAGLPLTAGFASEWLTLEALMQHFRIHQLAVQLATAVAGALVALTIGIAGVTFVRVIALSVFGRSPRRPVDGPPMPVVAGLAIAVPAVACVALAIAAPSEMRFIATGLLDIAGPEGRAALVSPWVIQPVFGGFSSLSPSWLALVIPALTLLTAAMAWLLSGRRAFRVRTVPAWNSAAAPDERTGYTSFGYANPMRKVLSAVLLIRAGLHRADGSAATDGAIARDGAGREVAGDLSYRIDVAEVVERYLYRPVWLLLRRCARLAKRLQSGRLDAYLLYMLVCLVAVIAVATALR